MVQLIITEKPSVSLKIAEALADKKPKKHAYRKKIPYYEIEHDGEKIFVVCAVGHLFTVAEKDKKGWTYPVFNVEWVPSHVASKSAAFTKGYLDAIKSVCKKEKATEFTVACDWDIEGEVIGYNILSHVCGKEDASRMNYSTTTKDDLRKAYDGRSKHINMGLAQSGLTRHVLDFFYGINLSRALTLSIKNSTGMFKLLSSGRVQGPALKILAERELEIKAFKSDPFWQLELFAKNGITALHKADKFWEEKQALDILKKVKGKDAKVDSVTRKQSKQAPPNPFDLTSLQLEAYKRMSLSPKDTLSVAQELYTNSYISYPRTSSNQLPESIEFSKILQDLAKQSDYKELANDLLAKKKLIPNNGKKKDAAHPAIYPTGMKPTKLGERATKLYALIVHRFMATFGEPATRESMKIVLNIEDEHFFARGVRTVDPGWHTLYGRFAVFKEEELPDVKEDEMLKVDDVVKHDKETQPPKRYTPASIIKELEKRDLGTKSTRSEIIENLYRRDYVMDKSLEVSIGLKTIETLEKYSPEILDDELTRHFEEEMKLIQDGKKSKEDVLKEAEKILDKVLKNFKKNETKIGKALAKAYKDSREKANLVGICNVCGDNLRIMYSPRKKTYFIACAAYPKCTNTYPLTWGLPKPTKDMCKTCGFAIVKIIRKGKRPFDYCINNECPDKVAWREEQAKKVAEQDAQFKKDKEKKEQEEKDKEKKEVKS